MNLFIFKGGSWLHKMKTAKNVWFPEISQRKKQNMYK